MCTCIITVFSVLVILRPHSRTARARGRVSVEMFCCGGVHSQNTHTHTHRDPLPLQRELKHVLCWLISNSNTAPNREVVFPKEKYTPYLCVLCLYPESVTSRESQIPRDWALSHILSLNYASIKNHIKSVWTFSLNYTNVASLKTLKCSFLRTVIYSCKYGHKTYIV